MTVPAVQCSTHRAPTSSAMQEESACEQDDRALAARKQVSSAVCNGEFNAMTGPDSPCPDVRARDGSALATPGWEGPLPFCECACCRPLLNRDTTDLVSVLVVLTMPKD
eukprot:418009-Rhodomonas_salina.6